MGEVSIVGSGDEKTTSSQSWCVDLGVVVGDSVELGNENVGSGPIGDG